MIAPLRETDPSTGELRQRLSAARRMIAETLLGPFEECESEIRPVAGWTAWGFAAWALAVLALSCWYTFAPVAR